ncbi:MAG: hypothetical protein ORN21_02740, partial [Methylophilaceae bacterium]|nr:hypothetical protein [Methylophilaceae bacterium]
MKIKKSRQKKLSASNPSAQNQQANDLSPMSVTEEQKLVDQVLVASSSAKPSEQAVESEDDNFAQRKLVEAEEEKEPSEQAVLAGKSSALTSSEVTTIKELTNAEAAQALSVDGDSLMTDALAEEGAGSEGAGSSAPAAASAVTTESFGKQHPNESGLGILALLAAGGAIAVAAAGGGGGGAAVPAPAPLPIGPRVSGIALPVATATTTNPVWFPVNALQPAVDGDLAITAVPFRQGAANNVIAGAAVASRLPSATATGVSYYNAGDVMTFTVTMSENVTVTGIPQLAINIGGTRVMANYAAGTGTAVLTFVYTVSAGQNDMNGVSIDANSLSLNSGSIVSAAANNGVPAGTAASLAHDAMMDNANYIVDTTLPVPNVPVLALPSSTVAGIEMGMVSGYQAQGRVTTATGGTFGVAAAATVDAPQGVMPAQNSQAGAITINAEKDSLVTLDFSRIAADGTTLRTVRKNVVATGASQAVDLTAAELTTLGSGMVTTLGYDVIQVKVVRSVDLAGNPSDLASISVNNDNSANGVIRFKLDTVAPTLLLAAAPLQQLTQIALSRPAIATVASLQDLAAGVAVHQWTDLVSSDPLTTHSTHSATALTQIATLNNINQYILTFTPPVASVISTPLVAISHALADTALTIVDSVGLVESSVSTRFNPTNNPTVTYTYRFSEKVIGLTFEDFTVVQTASDGTRINPISLNASNLVSSGDGKTYTLTVTPAPGTYQTDNDTLSVTLGAGAVIDAAGNPNALAIQTVKTIDTIAPVATTVAVTAGSGVNNASWYNVGDVLTITLTMDEAVKVVTGTPQLTIGLDGVVSVGARHGLIGLSDPSLKTVQASYASAVPHAANQLVFTYAIKAGDNTDNGVNIAAHALSLNGASITDVAGNAINLSGNAVFPAANVMANSNANFKIDTTAPVAPTLTLVTDTGFSGSDGLTSNATINVRGLELGSVANPWTGTTWQ